MVNVNAEGFGRTLFDAAYSLIFGMVEAVYSKTGGVDHQLIGLEFDNGKIVCVNPLTIDAENINRFPEDLQMMLDRWPVVVHVVEAWAAPGGDVPARDHPNRKDIVAITIHGAEVASCASCEVDPATKQVSKAPLVAVARMEGRFGRPLAVKH